MPLPSAREPLQVASARRIAAIGSSGWVLDVRALIVPQAPRGRPGRESMRGDRSGRASYHCALRCNRIPRSARFRAVRTPLAFAFVIALGALVAPASVAAPSVRAATRSAMTTAEAPDMSPATAEATLVA